MQEDAKKASDKIQLPFMMETLNKLSREETYLNLIVAICNKTAANLILTGGITESFFSKFWNKTRHLAILLFNIVLKF